jgi:uroporphyrinogen decarboxylase
MNQLLLRTLRGEPTERRPLWIMRQAGRYLPEYRSLRRQLSFVELCTRPAEAAEVTMMPLRRFPLDAAIVFADIMSPVAALGIDVDFAPGPVVENPLRSVADIDGLPDPPSEAIAPEVIETLGRVKAELSDDVALLGFSAGPWTLAAYLVEGQGKRGFPALRSMAFREPELLNDLMARLVSLSAKYLVAQARAGADAVQVFETWSGLLSASDWSRIVKPHLRTLLEAVRDAGVPRILFVQEAPHLVDQTLDLPADGFSFDWRIDLKSVRERVPATTAIQGNIDPAILLAGPQPTIAAATELLRQVPAQGHIVNLGHGILPTTPIESVEALVDVVHGAGERH